MSTPVDLRQLAVERPVAPSHTLVKKRAWLTRWGIPSAIAGGFLVLTGWSARDWFLPAKEVTVTPVILAKAEVQQAGTPLFQAAGWIEPRPTAVMASALVEGVVDKLLVIEGQEVTAGQPVAKLIDAEARLAAREANVALRLRRSELPVAEAGLEAAQATFDQPVQLEAAHAEAEAELARLNTEIKNLPFLIKAAEARLTFAEQELTRKKAVADAVAARVVQLAQSEFDSATAALQELKERGPTLEIQQKAWQRKCDALHTRWKLKTEETRALAEATAQVESAKTRVEQAELVVEAANLRLERMTIRAPITGRVLALHSRPGQRLMGMNAASERDASAVVSLYDPAQLQVRADVRLEDVPQAQMGQPVQIQTAASPQPLAGKVVAITSQADIGKNTLQVKVSIDEPPAVIKPDMIAQVTFLAPQIPGRSTDSENDPLRMLVPRELVEKTENEAVVWVTDPATSVARRRVVQLGQAGTSQLVEVAQGLSPLDKLIVSGREGIADGTRVRVTGEDRSLGKDSPSPTPAP
ncbi:MAG TPA: efflux RND transporter periplasmic adaptor subunit [Pirellulaceae bacterium]|nr:efflux RND transporter periplasmic adaptor subunit [Pirellulaceae bacterium]